MYPGKAATNPGGFFLMTQSHTMSKLLLRFLNDKSGAAAIEYALVAAGISVVIVVTVATIGSQLNSAFYDKINNDLK